MLPSKRLSTVFVTGVAAALAVAGAMTAGAATVPTPATGVGVGAASNVDAAGIPAVHVYYQRSDHGLTVTASPITTDLGGHITSAPAAFAQLSGEFLTDMVFARGTDDAIWYRSSWDDIGSWEPWASLGGTAAGAPTVSCFATGDTAAQPMVFLRSPGGALWGRTLDGTWSSYGGRLVSDPAATAAYGGYCPTGDVDVFALGTDHAVWEWTEGSWHRVGGSSTVAPTATGEVDRTTVLVARGTDDAAWMTTRPYGSQTWGPWHKIGGYFTSPVTAVFDISGPAGSLVVQGLGRDGNVWQGRNPVDTTTWTWSQVS